MGFDSPPKVTSEPTNSNNSISFAPSEHHQSCQKGEQRGTDGCRRAKPRTCWMKSATPGNYFSACLWGIRWHLAHQSQQVLSVVIHGDIRPVAQVARSQVPTPYSLSQEDLLFTAHRELTRDTDLHTCLATSPAIMDWAWTRENAGRGGV